MMLASDLPFDTYRFMRRALYTIALLPVLVWFGVQRREPQVPPVPNPPDGSLDGLMWRVLDYAQDLTGAQRGFIAWTHAEEPWTEIREEREKTRLSDRAGPQLLESWDRGHARVELFDVARGRGLVLTEDERAQQSRALLPAALSARSGISEGLLLPFGAASGEGIMLLGELRSPGVDLLRLGKAIAREAGTAFDRTAVGQMEREALVERTRSAIARDLHDSVAQSLAGACFRLEALRRNLRLGLGDVAADADRDIVSVRDALRQEQGHIRSLIETLRTPAQPQQHDLRADINRTLSDAGAHWGIAVALDAPGMVQVAGWLSHEVQQLVREAVANAARHGRAGRVTVRLGLADGRVNLHIQDDGVGFDAAGQDGTPWSISERVAAIGGDFSVESAPGCTRLAIVLPARETKG
jgi:signal transduction histidine kinase